MNIGDIVRVRRSDGSLSDQRFQIQSIAANGCGCTITEWPGQPDKRMAEQAFDTSLLVVDGM